MNNKLAYPVLIKKAETGYYVHIPDLNHSTQGNNIENAVEMARDLIGITCIDLQDEHKTVPKPHSAEIKKENESDIITLVDIDLKQYRKELEKIEKC